MSLDFLRHGNEVIPRRVIILILTDKFSSDNLIALLAQYPYPAM